MSLRPTAPVGNHQSRGHPFSRSCGGANLPSSLARGGHPSRLGLLTQEHLCRFSVRSWGARSPPPPPFHGPPQELGGPGSRPGYSRLRPVLAITALPPGLQRLSGVFPPRPPYPEASGVGPALPRGLPPPRHGNINPVSPPSAGTN